MVKSFVVAALFIFSSALAHDGVHDQWLKSLTNQNNISCCDGSDAFSVEEPDWEFGDEKHPYRVRQSPQHLWLNVEPSAVVKQKNSLGLVKVWPQKDTAGTWTYVHCFLPGTGI